MLTAVEFMIVEGPETGRRYPFPPGEILVGRAFSNDLILNHQDVSAQHLKVVVEKDGVFLQDLNSEKGTKLNGLLVSHEPLHNGDELQVGPYVFHISLVREEVPEQGASPDVLDELLHKGTAIHRPPLLILSLLLVVLAAYAGSRFWRGEKEGLDLAASGPLPLPVEGIFGYRVGGKNYVDKVEFSFTAEHPKYRLQFRPGFIAEPRLVEIYLNDRKLEYVPVTVDRWADESVSLDMPREALKAGEVNLVRFDNLKNPPGNVRWGIRDVRIQEVPIPRCDVDVARKYLRLAQEKYLERRINEANLYDAIQYLRQGEEYLIACEDPAMRNLLLDARTQYEDELGKIYDDYMFNARKFLKLKDLRAAQFEIEQILKKIPSEEDPRHRKAKELAERLGKK
ncbi:MAG: FHA domain-containing protein [bacterium]